MTETPVLSVKEQRKSLSARTKKKKKTFKSILSFRQNELCVVPEDQVSSLQNQLKTLLEVARLPQVMIPWSELKNFKKEERKKAKEELLENKKCEIISKKRERDKYLFGINAVAREINKGNVCAVLLAYDIEPKQLMGHVSSLALGNNVPCVLFQELRSVTELSLGFPCIALGLKKGFQEFNEIVRCICDITKCQKESDNSNLPQKDVDEVSDNVPSENTVEEPNLILNFTYAHRKDKSKRAFVPEGSKPKKPESEYIQISEDVSDILVHKNEELVAGISHTLRQDFNKNRKRPKIMSKMDDSSLVDKEDSNIIKKEKKKSIVLGWNKVNAEEILEVERKKAKQWIIDKKGEVTPDYREPYVMKLQSNPNRVGKRKINVKKQRE